MPFGTDQSAYIAAMLPNDDAEIKFTLQKAYEAMLEETGEVPTKMPPSTPNFTVLPHHLRAMARIMKDPRLGKGITTFESAGWDSFKQLSLKFILNAIHHNPTIHTLILNKGNFIPRDSMRIARFIRHTPHLTKLEIPYSTSTGDRLLIAVLTELRTNKSLLHLNLRGSSYSEYSFSLLLMAVAENTTLEKLDLQGSDFSYHNRAQRFMQAIIDNEATKLQRIEFPLMRGAVLWTAQMLEYNRSLTTVDLSGTPLSSYVAILKIALERNTTLRHLNLRQTTLSDRDLVDVLEPLWTNTTLTSLNISNNPGLGAESAKNIGELLFQNNTLEELDLSQLSGMGKDKLASRLAKALISNSSVHVLDLSDSYTSGSGIAELSETLSVNHGLKSLNLSNNASIDDSAVTTLVKGLKANFGLHTLILDNCKFGDTAVKAMLPWLKTTRTLTKRFSISSNKISEATHALLWEAIRSNPALKKLNVSWVHVEKSLSEKLKALGSDVAALFASST